MTLSPTERRFILRWRRFQRAWRWCRWLTLAICVLNLAWWGLLLHIQTSSRAKSPEDSLGASTDVALCLLLLFVFSGFCVHTLARWRGDPKITLLLKLYDLQAEEMAKADGPANRSQPLSP